MERLYFPEALLNGMASNHGLYMLARKDVPKLSRATIKKMTDQTYAEIAFEVLYPYLQWHISDEELRSLLQDAYDETIIPTPIQHVRDDLYIMWLTKGPTCSFKDYAARFYARILNYFLRKRGLTRIVLVATSGDTGGAIADALKGMSNAFVVIFYPADSISVYQRKQMTTLRENVLAFSVNGDFNVCQQLVKCLLGDKQFAREISQDENIFTSANSISLGRLLPQIVYPFYGYSRIRSESNEYMTPIVPSGNFGDMMGTVLAKEMGLPIDTIVCAVNENKTFPEFLRTGAYIVQNTVQSPSSAMNVNNPSNMARLFDFYGGNISDERDASTGLVVREGVIAAMPNMQMLRSDIVSYSIGSSGLVNSDHRAIKDAYAHYDIVLDPHGAVGWAAFEMFKGCYLHHVGQRALLYETADPGKFPDYIEQVIGVCPEIPPQMRAQEKLWEGIFYIGAEPDFDEKDTMLLSADHIAHAKELLASVFKNIFALSTL